jgi:hypothetical protein
MSINKAATYLVYAGFCNAIRTKSRVNMYKKSSGVRAEFNKDRDGRLLISFFDPAYVRADAIIIDRKDLSVHAVLHEASHYIGAIHVDLMPALDSGAEVLLSAMQSNGKPVSLKTNLFVNA